MENTSNIPRNYLNVENPIITVIFQRIDLLLPYISGYSIQQVLSEPSYLQAKSHILKLSTNKSYLSDLISCIYNLLIQILKNDIADTLYDKNLNTLNSIYIIISLLSNILNNLNVHENLNHSASDIFKSVGLKISSFSLIDAHLTSKPSTELDINLAKSLLILLFSLKSDQDCIYNIFSITDYNNSNDIIKPSTTPTTTPTTTTTSSSSTTMGINSFTSTSPSSSSSSSSSSTPTSTSNSTPTSTSNSTPINQNQSNSFPFSNPLSSINSIDTASHYMHNLTNINTNSTSNNSNSDNHNNNTHNNNNNNHNNISSPISSSSSSASSSNSSSSNNTSTLNSLSHISSTMIDDHNEASSLLKRKLLLKNSNIVQMINNCIFSVFRYIAASNSVQYFEFERSIFKNIPLESLYIKGSHILQFSFLSSSNFNSYIQLIRDLMYVTKRQSQRSLFLHYFSKSIISWAINRSENFLKVVESPSSKNAEILFDILAKNLDSKYCPKVYYSIMSCLMLFQPKHLLKFINEKSSKSTTQVLKRSISNVTKINSTRQKFLSEFIQLVNKSPENAQPLISFLLVGCSISKYNKNHPLYNFVLFMKDSLIKQLKLDSLDSNFLNLYPSTNSNNSNEIDLKNFKINNDLRIGVLTISIIVNPFTLPDQISNVLNSPKCSMCSFVLFTGAFRLLVSMPSLNELAFRIIQDLSPTLLKILSSSCDALTKTNKDSNDDINDNLILQLSSINRTSSFSSSVGSSINTNNNNTTSNNSNNNNNTTTSNNNNNNNNNNKLKFKSNNQTNSSPLNSSFRTSPLKLTHDDTIIDNISINSNESIKSIDLDSQLPYVKVTKPMFELKENIHYSALKSQISKASPYLLKENIINLLMIYSSYPFLCYINVETEKGFDFILFEKSFKKLIDKIVKLLYLNNDDLIDATESLLKGFCLTVSNIHPNKVFSAYIATAILIDSISIIGTSLSIDNNKRNRIIKLIFNLIEIRSEHSDLKLLFDYNDIVKNVHLSGSCGRMIKNFERVIYLGLFSSNIETIRISKRLLQFYNFVISAPHHLPTCFDMSNLDLSNKILSDKMTFGLITIRKKMRDRLCHLKRPTETLLSVWSLMYEKTALSYDYEHGPNLNSTLDEINEFFKHHHVIKEIEIYSEYLASLGGIILSKEFSTDLRQPLLKRSLERFIGNKFISLFSKDPKKREHSREILSVAIHPYLCGMLLCFIKKVLPCFAENLNKGEYIVCELFLSVLRSVCQVESSELFAHSTELWNINFKLLKMLNIETNYKPEFLRLKLKLCKLQVLFLSKLDELALNGNILKKNEYARIAADYLESSFAHEIKEIDLSQKKVLSFSFNKMDSNNKKMSNKLKEFKESELKDLLMDIKVEVSIMLKMIFYKLPLDTPKQAGSAEDIKSAETVIFSNYFNLFVRLLEKLHEAKNDEDSYTPVAHRSSSIIKEIIQALINLLNANSTIGLKYSLPLGYHSDELIRVSFIDVFSKIIKEIYSNYETKISLKNLYEQQIEIFTSDFDLFLSAASCCPKSEIEAYANSILQLPINQKKKMKLLLSLIRIDVLQTSDKNEILRSNTVGTRVVALYSRDNATEYLKSIFQPIFNQMIENEDFFEIEKVGNMNEDEKEKNLKLFFKYLNLISDAIFDSISYMPIGIRLISKTIFDSTTKVMPEIKYNSINSYLFLRLINPTIVSPEHAEITKCSNPYFKRSLMQLARVIQTMVNESPIRMPLLEKRIDDLAYSKKNFFSFMKNVVTFNIEQAYGDVNSFDEKLQSIDKMESQESPVYLQGFFYDNWMEIRDVYCNESFGYEISKEDKFETIRKIDNILSSSGLPKRLNSYKIPEAVKNDKSAKGILLYDFMSKTSLTLEDAPFIKVTITKDGLPLICINSLEFTDGLTGEAYVYNMLQTVSKFWEEPYALLVDLTSFRQYPILKQGRELLKSLVGVHYKSNCKRIYYVNMSPSFFELFKNFDKEILLEEASIDPEFIFISSNDDEKTMNKHKLISYTNATTNDARVTFNDVSIYQEESNRFIPVKLKIGYNFIQIYPALPPRIKIRNKMYVINLVDCYKIKGLDNISVSSYTGIANEISMFDMSTDRKIILTSPKKIEIMRTMYFSRAILNNNNYTEDDYGVGSNPKFTVGHLMTIAFSGLLSKSTDIRKASYALLASIQQSVGLQTGKFIDSVEGVVFPYGNTDYICAVSSSVAENHPTLTYAFIHAFFGAYNSLNEEEKNSMVLCVSPWIKNIYTYVYLSNSVLGPSRACDIIRKCVRASRDQKQFQVFGLFIWPQLSLEDGLIEIIIDEIVAASIDHEAEGNDWQRITKYWPLRSSIEICSVLIKRMKEKSYNMPLDETDIEAHSRWIETTVLARFLSYLIFDSLLFVDRYISDIFYIVTIYMDHGPLELRSCLINLLARTFHSYLSKPSLTVEQHDMIKDKIELLNGARFRMLFGLTRDDNELFKRNKLMGTDISSKANAITTLCELLTEFLQDFCLPEEYELQMIKWNSCVCKVAFDYNAQLQSRAILVMGSLTKQGISSLLVMRFISLLRKNGLKAMAIDKSDSNSLVLVICTLHSFGKAIVGIDSNSIFHPLVFWYHVNILFSNDISFFRYGVDFLKATFNSIEKYLKLSNKNMTVVDYIFGFKPLLGDLFDDTEMRHDFKLTRKNFDVVLSLLICKGLESPFALNYSIDTLKVLLRIRYAEHLRKPNDLNNDFNCYLFFIFLTSSTDEEMIKILEECGLNDIEYLTGVNNSKIPKNLLEWFENLTLNVYSICLGAANYFMKQKLDELASTRVISLYVELYKKKPKIILKLFRQIDGVLQKFIRLSTTPNLLETVMNMVVSLMNDSEFHSYQLTNEEWNDKLDENHIKGVADFTFGLNNIFCDSILLNAIKGEELKFKVEKNDKLMQKIMELYKHETE
ncbi:mitotic spindle checkpoint protein Bub3 [Pichia californica]|uniref:Mitotic spindle checkpoint protein Bub3 n=1 Tax=Pichia californica TaxID=460514 RepID=A0A9P6WKI6_9ASCO|nr:mitotic spindle checkpoint protein Bub3 [[Candida] californica]